MKQPLRLCTKHQLKWVFESVRLVIVFEVIIEPPLFVVLVISYLCICGSSILAEVKLGPTAKNITSSLQVCPPGYHNIPENTF